MSINLYFNLNTLLTIGEVDTYFKRYVGFGAMLKVADARYYSFYIPAGIMPVAIKKRLHEIHTEDVWDLVGFDRFGDEFPLFE